MKTITYNFADGEISAVDVSDEFYSVYRDLEKTDELSDRKYSRRTQSLERSVENGWDVADPDADVAVIFEKKENDSKLYEAVFALPPEQQTLIKTVFFHRIPQQYIATQEGVSRFAINKRLTRILRKLKKVLSQTVHNGDFRGY